MPSNTDERIIQMKFENRQFERNIAQSKKSLEDFKKEMNFEDTSRGLEQFSKSANKLSFDTLFSNIQKLTDRFTGLGDAGDYILRRIRAGIEGAAMQMESFAKSISVAQIGVGQGKYDALNKAVMTVVSTGKYTEQQAYDVFDRLMTYTAETSYSFSDMVNQIATFTSTGVQLDKAEMAMEGIANLSAKAGQGVMQASNAMSIFAKALGQSFLGLNQWQSLNLSAHIITEEFRQTLVDTAVEMGTLTKESDKYYTNTKKGKKTLVEVSNLENTLNQQWATSAVLMETLQKYYFEDIDNPDANWDTFAGTAAKAAQRALNLTDAINAMKEATSGGWMESFRIIFGDLSEAMEVFTNIANRAIESLDRISEWRNNVLKVWSREGGRNNLIDIILGDYEKDVETGAYGFIDMLDDIGKVVYEGFVDFLGIFAGKDDRAMFKDPVEGAEYFQAWLGIKLNQITQKVENFMQGIRNWFNETIDVGGVAKTRMEVLHEIVMGIAAAFALGYQVLTGFGSFILDIAAQLQPSFDKIEGFLGTLGLTLYDATAATTEAKTIPQFFHELAEEFRPVTDGINEVIAALTDMLGITLETDKEKGKTRNFFQVVGNGLKTIAKIISTIGKPIFNFIKDIIEIIGILLNDGINAKSLTEIGQKIGLAIGDLVTGIADALPESLGFLKEWIHNLFGGAKDDVDKESESLFSKIFGEKQKTDTKAKKANGNGNAALGVLTSGTNLMTWISVLGAAGATGLVYMAIKTVLSIGWFFDELGASLKKGFRVQYDNNADYFSKIVKGIVMLVASVVVLGTMPLNGLIQGVIALTTIMGIIFVMFKLLKNNSAAGKVSEQMAFAGQMAAIAASITLLGIAIGVISLALIPFALMRTDQLINAISGLSWVLIEVIAFMAIAKRLNVSTKNLAGFTGFAFSIGILIFALKPFANMEINQYIQAISGLAWVMLELIAFMKIIDTLELDTGKLAGFAGFAFSIGILIFALKPFANMETDKYMHAISGLAWILLELIATIGIIKKLNLVDVKLNGFIGFAVSMAILVFAIQPLANMDPFQYTKAVLGLGFVLAELVAAMYIIKKNDMGAVKLAGFIGFALSIGVLILAIQPLANMDPAQYTKAILGIAFVLAEIIGAMYIIKSVNVDSIKLAGFIGFAVSIFILIKAIQPLAAMDSMHYTQAILGVAFILVELIGFMYMLKNLKINTVQIGGFMAFAAGLSTLMSSLSVFTDMEWDDVSQAIVGFGGVMIFLIGFMKMIDGAKFNLKQMMAVGAAIGMLSALMLVFSLSLSIVKGMDWGLVAAFSAGLAIIMIGMSASILALSNIPLGMGLKGIALLSAGLLAILGVVSLIAPILLGSLGNSLANMSGKLAIMADMFQIFSSRMASTDGAGMEKAKKFINDLFDLMGDMGKIGSINFSSSTFSKAIFSLGTGLESFSWHTRSIDAENNGIGLIKGLASCANDLDTITKLNLDALTSKITGLGGAMMLYAKGAQEVSGGEINSDTDVGGAITLMQKISEALSEKGGFTIPENMPQPDDLSLFGAQLAALAGALVLFEDAGKGLGTGTEQAIGALQFFEKLKDELEKDAFLKGLGTILGFNVAFNTAGLDVSAVEEFGKNIESLGQALNMFAAQTTEVDPVTGEIKPTSYEAAIEALVKFSELENSLPKLGGIRSWWEGNQQTLSDLGNDVQQLGSGLMTFSNKITGQGAEGQEGITFDSTATDSAISAMEGMLNFLEKVNQKLPRFGGLKNFFTDMWNGKGWTFEDLGTQVGKIGDGLTRLGKGLNTGGWSKDTGAEHALAALESLMTIMEKLQQIENGAQLSGQNVFSLAEKLSSFVQEFSMRTDGISNMVWMMSEITNMFNEYKKEGNGIDKSDIETFATMAQAIASLASVDPKYDWKTIGVQIDTGIADGLLEGMATVTSAAAEVTQSAYDTAVASAHTIVASISTILSEEVVAQPTITPVLDMSQAIATLNSFTGQFNSHRGIISGVGATIMANAIGNQNGTDLSGIHARMDQIDQDIVALGDAMGKMQVVLDTGVVAGGLTPQIDGNIGRRMLLAARRNTLATITGKD